MGQNALIADMSLSFNLVNGIVGNKLVIKGSQQHIANKQAKRAVGQAIEAPPPLRSADVTIAVF